MEFLDIFISRPFLLYAILLGPAIGSFSAVYFERVPRGVGLTGRSKCACGRLLKVTENIPILGYIKVRGVAKCCGKKIPINYLVFEIVFFLVFTLLALISSKIFFLTLVLYFLLLLLFYLYIKNKI